MGPTVSQMFRHPTGGTVTAHALSGAGGGPGMWIWLLLLLVLLLAYGGVRRWLAGGSGSRLYAPFRPGVPRAGRGIVATGSGLGPGPASGHSRGFAGVGSPPGGIPTWLASFLTGIGRRGRGTSAELLRYVGLSQEGSLRVESRVQLAPGRWLVRVRNGEESLILAVGPDIQVIANRVDAAVPGQENAPVPGPLSGGPGEPTGNRAAGARGEGLARASSQPASGQGSTFARILGESISRMGGQGTDTGQEQEGGS